MDKYIEFIIIVVIIIKAEVQYLIPILYVVTMHWVAGVHFS